MSSDPALKPEGPLDKLTGSLSTSTNQGPGIFKEGWAGTAETGKAGGEPGDTRYVKNPVTAETACKRPYWPHRTLAASSARGSKLI